MINHVFFWHSDSKQKTQKAIRKASGELPLNKPSVGDTILIGKKGREKWHPL
jgi:hypothetical protein